MKGKAKTHISLFEKTDIGVYVFLFGFGQSVPPIAKLIGILNFACHRWNMPLTEWLVEQFLWKFGAEFGGWRRKSSDSAALLGVRQSRMPYQKRWSL